MCDVGILLYMMTWTVPISLDNAVSRSCSCQHGVLHVSVILGCFFFSCQWWLLSLYLLWAFLVVVRLAPTLTKYHGDHYKHYVDDVYSGHNGVQDTGPQVMERVSRKYGDDSCNNRSKTVVYTHCTGGSTYIGFKFARMPLLNQIIIYVTWL